MHYGMAAYAIVRDSEARRRPSSTASPYAAAAARGFDNFEQWLSGTELRARIEAAGIFGVEPRPQAQPDRHARAGPRADRGI
jgi:hypothetical protein